MACSPRGDSTGRERLAVSISGFVLYIAWSISVISENIVHAMLASPALVLLLSMTSRPLDRGSKEAHSRTCGVGFRRDSASVDLDGTQTVRCSLGDRDRTLRPRSSGLELELELQRAPHHKSNCTSMLMMTSGVHGSSSGETLGLVHAGAARRIFGVVPILQCEKWPR